VLNGAAVEGCCWVAEGALLCGVAVDCGCCATAGIEIADASKSANNWLGEIIRVEALAFIEIFVLFDSSVR
jgi:hypothetical protein